MLRDCFLLGNTKEPRLEPVIIPFENRFNSYYVLIIYASSKSNKRNLGGVPGIAIC